MVYVKVCFSSRNASICDNLHDPQNAKDLDEVQNNSSWWILGTTMALSIPSIVTVNLLGSWGDSYGRKLPLFIPSIGAFISNCAWILIASMDFSGPVWPILIPSAISGVFGGFVSCIMAVNSYVSNISTETSRTSRVSKLESMSYLGGAIGPFFGGLILESYGEMDVSYLYVKDKPLQWDYKKYSYYFGLKYALGFSALIVGSRIFSHFCLSDYTICVTGLISKIGGLVLLGFSSTDTLMFIVPLATALSSFCIPSLRALLSKQVEAGELGKLFALVAITENLCTLLGSVQFNSLYPLMRKIDQGFIFLYAAATQVIPLIIITAQSCGHNILYNCWCSQSTILWPQHLVQLLVFNTAQSCGHNILYNCWCSQSTILWPQHLVPSLNVHIEQSCGQNILYNFWCSHSTMLRPKHLVQSLGFTEHNLVVKSSCTIFECSHSTMLRPQHLVQSLGFTEHNLVVKTSCTIFECSHSTMLRPQHLVQLLVFTEHNLVATTSCTIVGMDLSLCQIYSLHISRWDQLSVHNSAKCVCTNNK
uniref:Uncharacterized protein n=1 Tax=Timema poppense TaxID=170557 RepID=A0A7R9CSJ5_TIMPO|nr:unnamed protein product [Timema poppensis]